MTRSHELLFVASRVDAAWLAQFAAELKSSPDWLPACAAAVETRYRAEPQARDGFSRVAYALTQLGRAAESLDWFQRDWPGRMGRWQFLRYLEALIAAGRSDDAESRVVEYYTVHPEAKDGWATVAAELRKAGQVARALDLLRRDAALDRASPFWLVRLAAMEAEEGKWDAAAPLVDRAYRADANQRDAWARLAEIRRAQGDEAEALALLRRDAALGRASSHWLVRLAPLEARQGLWDRAIELIEHAYRLDPKQRDGFARLAEVHQDTGEAGRALELLRRDAALDRLSPFWLIRVAPLEARDGRWEEAERLVELAYARDPEKVERNGFARLAEVHRENGNDHASGELLERDFTAGRLGAGPRLWLAVHRAGREDWDSAFDLVAAAYHEDATLRDGYSRLARHKAASEDWAGVLALFERDRQLDRLTTNVLTLQAQSHAHLGDYARAEADVRQIYASDPDKRDQFATIALIADRNDAHDVAQRFFAEDHAARRLSAHRALDYANVLARHDPAQAEVVVAEAYAESPACRNGYAHVGWTAFEHKLVPSALPYFQRDSALGRLAPAWTSKALKLWSEEHRSTGYLAAMIRGLLRWLDPATILEIAPDLLATSSLPGSAREWIAAHLVRDGRLRFKGAELEFGDLDSLETLFDEIFVFDSYHFPASSSRPRIIDAGANFGLATYYFRTLHPEATIVAFEPDPRMAQVLRGNVERNGWQNVTVVEAALAPTAGRRTFHSTPDQTMAGSLTDRMIVRGAAHEAHEVECHTLRDYLQEPVDYLKLDIEGAELDVLRASADCLGRVQHLFCEYHRLPGQSLDSLLEIIRILEAAGFAVEVSSQSRLRPHGARGVERVPIARSLELWGTRLEGAPGPQSEL